jgi:hypothetical protein
LQSISLLLLLLLHNALKHVCCQARHIGISSSAALFCSCCCCGICCGLFQQLLLA